MECYDNDARPLAVEVRGASGREIFGHFCSLFSSKGFEE